MSKVIRLNNKNIELLERTREAYINYYTFNEIYKICSDNDLITMALAETIESLKKKEE